MAENIQQLKFFQSNSLEKAKQEFNTLFAQKNSRLAIIFSLIFILATFLATLIFYNQMPPEMPLFYNRPWGEEQLVSKQTFLIVIIASLIMVIINLRLASIFFKRNKILSQITIWTNFLIVLLIVIDVFMIFSLTVF